MQKHESRGGDIQLLSCIQATSIFAHKHKRYLPPLRREKKNKHFAVKHSDGPTYILRIFRSPSPKNAADPCHFYHCHRITSTAIYLIFMTFIYQYLCPMLLQPSYIPASPFKDSLSRKDRHTPFLSAAWNCCLQDDDVLMPMRFHANC